MRPFRVIALAGAAVAFWAGTRVDAVKQDMAERFQPVARVAAPSGAAAPLPAPSLPSTLSGDTRAAYPDRAPDAVPAPGPGVMVYSYPAPGSLEPPRRLYRLAVAQPRSARAKPYSEPDRPASDDPPRRVRAPGPPTHVVAPTPPDAAPAATAATPDMNAAAYEAATRAYADLRAGDRRAAASAFAVALSLAPDHPRAAEWRKEARRLSRWWRVETYTFNRQGTPLTQRPTGLTAASPVLGGGAIAGLIAVTPNALSRRRIELQARFAIPYRGFTHADNGRAQAAAGIAYQPFARVPVTVAVERLFALGSLGRNDFQARLYGGTARRVRGIDLEFFGETGVVGRRPDAFAGAQLIAEKPFHLPGKIELGLGLGTWGAVQRTNRTVDRVDIGPTLRLSRANAPVTLRVDYRARVLGTTAPGNGVALTVSSRY